ncbi:MAG: malonic semialdehyde reductase [Alphaproteobacteria bacterium]|nr:malonic semialdehyde reductase [Alphaproteobacteria bacterium]
MSAVLNDEGQDILFREARSHRGWLDEPVADDLLRSVYDLTKMGPTSSNSCPLRMIFVVSEEARVKLVPCVSQGNQEKTESASVTVILGYDTRFYEIMDRLAPHSSMGSHMAENPERAREFARTQATLQAAYFFMAARALGLDCGPIGGYDAEKTDAEFFSDGRVKSIMLCNLGRGDASLLKPRAPRPEFDEACSIV